MGFNSGFKGLTASGFTLERGGSSVVGRAALLPQRSKVKPDAVNAVVISW